MSRNCSAFFPCLCPARLFAIVYCSMLGCGNLSPVRLTRGFFGASAICASMSFRFSARAPCACPARRATINCWQVSGAFRPARRRPLGKMKCIFVFFPHFDRTGGIILLGNRQSNEEKTRKKSIEERGEAFYLQAFLATNKKIEVFLLPKPFLFN